MNCANSVPSFSLSWKGATRKSHSRCFTQSPIVTHFQRTLPNVMICKLSYSRLLERCLPRFVPLFSCATAENAVMLKSGAFSTCQKIRSRPFFNAPGLSCALCWPLVARELFTRDGMTLAGSSHALAGQKDPFGLVASSLLAWAHL